jgi:hypothetical protein
MVLILIIVFFIVLLVIAIIVARNFELFAILAFLWRSQFLARASALSRNI